MRIHSPVFITNLRDIQDSLKPSYLEAQWLVTSKYKLRQKGETVRDGDYIILRNVRDDNQCLLIESSSSKFDTMHSALNLTADMGLKLTIKQKFRKNAALNLTKINTLQSNNNNNGANNVPVVNNTNTLNQLHYGDFITIYHIERNSELISRIDNEADFHPPYAQSGHICRDYFNNECTSNSSSNNDDPDSYDKDNSNTKMYLILLNIVCPRSHLLLGHLPCRHCFTHHND